LSQGQKLFGDFVAPLFQDILGDHQEIEGSEKSYFPFHLSGLVNTRYPDMTTPCADEYILRADSGYLSPHVKRVPVVLQFHHLAIQSVYPGRRRLSPCKNLETGFLCFLAKEDKRLNSFGEK